MDTEPHPPLGTWDDPIWVESNVCADLCAVPTFKVWVAFGLLALLSPLLLWIPITIIWVVVSIVSFFS